MIFNIYYLNIKYIYFLVFIYSIVINVYADTEKDDSYKFYISKIFSNQNSTPSITVDKTSALTKWFDDHPSQASGIRTEIGVESIKSGYTFSFRDQTINGSHLGAASKYSCFLFFCAWVDYSIVSGLSKSDQIDYRIGMQQVWAKKAFDLKYLELGLLGGINNIKMSLDISGASSHFVLEGSAPLPFIGGSAKYPLTDKLALHYDLHYSKVSKAGTSLKFMDSELELTYQIMDSLLIAIGENQLIFNLKKQTSSSNLLLNVPQRSPYLKISLIY